MGISEATFYNWKKKYGGLGVSKIRRLKQLENGNQKLKQLVADLMNNLEKLTVLETGFISKTESMDLTTPAGKALVGMLAVFVLFERDLLSEQAKEGIAHARSKVKPHGRLKSTALKAKKV